MFVNGTVQLVAQGEEKVTATIDARPDTFALKRFSQGRGFIKRGGVSLAGITGGSLTFSNNLKQVRVIRDDGGRFHHRDMQRRDDRAFRCATLVEPANGDPVVVEYGFTMAEGWTLTFELFRVFLLKPKCTISEAGGVEASLDWRAAYDEDSDTMLDAAKHSATTSEHSPSCCRRRSSAWSLRSMPADERNA
jgi:hypothetical protein